MPESLGERGVPSDLIAASDEEMRGRLDTADSQTHPPVGVVILRDEPAAGLDVVAQGLVGVLHVPPGVLAHLRREQPVKRREREKKIESESWGC